MTGVERGGKIERGLGIERKDQQQQWINFQISLKWQIQIVSIFGWVHVNCDTHLYNFIWYPKSLWQYSTLFGQKIMRLVKSSLQLAELVFIKTCSSSTTDWFVCSCLTWKGKCATYISTKRGRLLVRQPVTLGAFKNNLPNCTIKEDILI